MACEGRRSMDERVAREVRAHGTLLPPWRRFPDYERYSIGWRMGSGEDHLILLGHWTADWTRDDWLAYLRPFAPIPPEWHDWVTWALGLETGDEDDEALDARGYDREAELARLGLV